ncbi:copper resistance protein NlpE [Sphingobacterium gobiense]|uniref:Copper resistance protein NlpE n=1 Tax=Sphingobacterium gobiense TaxID=1382456 RepID=A0A2S9JVB5_9SPHI|nr:copper resistance protein NlpE [Sphingobacterium gobiense]PRD57180.1 hypothetical protein C5749_08250 [Sphingobacterium gobiense]
MIITAKTLTIIKHRLTFFLFLSFLFSACVDLSKPRDEDGAATDTPAERQGHSGNSAAQDDESTTDVSVNPSEFEGTYEATLPCGDCDGVHTIIVINNNHTFRISSEYLGKNKKIEDNGPFKLIENASIIHLKGTDTDLKLKIGEDKLFQLDKDDQVIEDEHAKDFTFEKKDT